MKRIPWALIPQPRSCRFGPPSLVLPGKGTIGVADHSLWPVVEESRALLGPWPAAIARAGSRDALTLARADLPREAYRLRIDRKGIRIEAAGLEGARNGLRTLQQLVGQAEGGRLPFAEIDDEPALADRGVYYDVTRGRVPLRSALFDMTSRLAEYKINQFQLYVEYTFHFRGHPLIGRGADPLTADDMLALDEHCSAKGIEFVPSLASLGHLPRILTLPPYRHLAEDWGVGRLKTPADCIDRRIGWSLAVANPEVYTFLDELYAEFLPCFRSSRFNATCDEAYDMGCGQSYDLARRIGRGRLLLRHILKVRELAARYGKQLQIWADLVRKDPDVLADLPEDVELLDWHYHAETDYDRIADFSGAGHHCLVCPSVNGFRTLFPLLHEATANIAGWAAAARKHGAQGLLNTDWGDSGHQNFNEYSWHGFLFGAEQAWNPDADQSTFTRRFCKLFLGVDDPDCASALDELGDVAHLRPAGVPQALWLPLFFARPGKEPDALWTPNSFGTSGGEKPLRLEGALPTRLARKGRLLNERPLRIDAALGAETAERLQGVRRVLAAALRPRGRDPAGVLPYWLFAADAMSHAARKLTVLGPGGKDTPTRRRALAREMDALQTRFKHLWMARNRRSEIDITLNKYRRVVKTLQG